MKILVFLIVVLMMSPGGSAVLKGYGEVESCFGEADETIPTCDGSEYQNLTFLSGSYCYIPSLGCNMKVLIEGYVSYDKATEYAEKRESINIVTQGEYDGRLADVYCRMVYPYEGVYVAYNLDSAMPFYDVDYCNALYRVDNGGCVQNGASPSYCYNEYDSWFTDDEKLASFMSAVFATNVISEIPCEIGINKLMLSTGASFQLFAEKYTEHALVVSYKDEKCYVKLEEGAGGLNVNYNGVLYHAIE